MGVVDVVCDPCRRPNEYQPEEEFMGWSCAKVAKGMYKINDFDARICELGFRCIEGAKLQCNSNNTYQNENGQSDCKMIPQGYYKIDDVSQPQLCETGFSCPDGSRIACTGRDVYQDETGQTSCKPVPAGHYKLNDTAAAEISTTATTTGSSTETQTGTTTATTSQTTTITQGVTSGDLASEAVAIGSGVGVLILAVMGAAVWRRRSNRRPGTGSAIVRPSGNRCHNFPHTYL